MEIIKEACVENLSQAITAEKNGAHRIELCGRLDLGGVTPSKELIKDCLEHLSIPIKVMIRPRGGDFVYTQAEIDTMIADIEFCKQSSVPEIVLGVLTENNQVDRTAMSRLSANVGEMPITFHKAIDEIQDYKSAIQTLKEIPQVKYILTSGLAPTAEEGKKILLEMIHFCGEEITVIVAGKVTDLNIDLLHSFLGAREYHGKKIVG